MLGGLTATNNVTLTLTNGVCIGLNSTAGLTLRSGSKLISEGKQPALNRIVHYKTVQEQPLTWGATNSTSSLVKWAQGGGELNSRFTQFSQLAAAPAYLFDASGFAPGPISLRDCQLYNSYFPYVYPVGSSTNPCTIGFTNNYLQRVKLDFTQGYLTYGPLSVLLKNNLFRFRFQCIRC